MGEALDWTDIKYYLMYEEMQGQTNPDIKVEKNDIIHPKDVPRFEESSTTSMNEGAESVYREEHDENSVQIREYDDVFEAQLDQFNPNTGIDEAAAHAVIDVLGLSL